MTQSILLFLAVFWSGRLLIFVADHARKEQNPLHQLFNIIMTALFWALFYWSKN
jgi:hypothetical protein